MADDTDDDDINASLLNFLADRLVNVYGESPNTDFIRAAKRQAAKLREPLGDDYYG